LEYGVKLQVGDVNVTSTGKIFNSINPPFILNLDITGSEIVGKKLIGYENSVKITSQANSSISNLSFSNIQTLLNFGGYNDYFSIAE
jgi:hypothetical protein